MQINDNSGITNMKRRGVGIVLVSKDTMTDTVKGRSV